MSIQLRSISEFLVEFVCLSDTFPFVIIKQLLYVVLSL